MITRYIEGLQKTIARLESQSRDYSESISEWRAVCLSLMKQIRLSGSATESDVRVKLQLEGKIDKLLNAEKSINSRLAALLFLLSFCAHAFLPPTSYVILYF